MIPERKDNVLPGFQGADDLSDRVRCRLLHDVVPVEEGTQFAVQALSCHTLVPARLAQKATLSGAGDFLPFSSSTTAPFFICLKCLNQELCPNELTSASRVVGVVSLRFSSRVSSSMSAGWISCRRSPG
jgi:hypothetical protein